MVTLNKGLLSISVCEHGAELSSIIYNGREYLWQGDPEFWGRHSPVLFPIVGMVWDKKYRTKGQEFSLGQHGFARDMDFTLISQTKDEVWFKLSSNDETKTKYPYDFKLEIGYRLGEKSVEVIWKVSNTSARENLFYQIGAHPAFHWPLLSDSAIRKGTAAMKEELKDSKDRGFVRLSRHETVLKSSRIVSGGGVDPSLEYDVKTDTEGYVPVDTSSFDGDAWIFENSQVNEVTICDAEKTKYISVKFEAPVVGIWSSPGKNAPFICIEPWYGRADEAGYDGLFEDKKWIQKLPEGESRLMSYEIIIE